MYQISWYIMDPMDRTEVYCTTQKDVVNVCYYITLNSDIKQIIVRDFDGIFYDPSRGIPLRFMTNP